MRYGYEAGGREDGSWIAHIKTYSFLQNPGGREVISRAHKKTVIAVNILGGVVTKTEGGDQLLVSHPLFVDEAIGSKARPEKSTNAGSGGQRAIPVRTEVIGIA